MKCEPFMCYSRAWIEKTKFHPTQEPIQVSSIWDVVKWFHFNLLHFFCFIWIIFFLLCSPNREKTTPLCKKKRRFLYEKLVHSLCFHLQRRLNEAPSLSKVFFVKLRSPWKTANSFVFCAFHTNDFHSWHFSNLLNYS